MSKQARSHSHSHAVVLTPRKQPHTNVVIPRNTALKTGDNSSTVLLRGQSVRGSPERPVSPKRHTSRPPIVMRGCDMSYREQRVLTSVVNNEPTAHTRQISRALRRRSARIWRIRSFAAASLMLCMAFQPIYIALASDIPEEVSAPIESTDSSNSLITESSPVQPDDSNATIPESTSGETNEIVEEEEEQNNDGEVGTEGVVVDDESETDADERDPVSTEHNLGTTTPILTDATSTTPIGEQGETSTSTVDEVTGNGHATSTTAQEHQDNDGHATSTDNAVSESDPEADEVVDQQDEAHSATENASSTDIEPRATSTETFSLGDHDCTTLADGALYCVERSAEGLDEALTGALRVYARAGTLGNKEIFFVDGGRTTQITHTSYDNFAPMYDPQGNQIVWNALMNDRLQIMHYDHRSGAIRQLTDTSYNNSNPQVAGSIVVWQAWIDTNWEIMQADLARTPINVTQLTRNNAHDMFPKIYGDLITWQTKTRTSWHVVVYDRASQSFEYIETDGEGAYENPRFALLFDERNEASGDVTVVGYDVATRSEVPLTPVEQNAPSPTKPLEDTGEALPSTATSTSSTIKTTQRGEGDDRDLGIEPHDDMGDDLDDDFDTELDDVVIEAY